MASEPSAHSTNSSTWFLIKRLIIRRTGSLSSTIKTFICCSTEKAVLARLGGFPLKPVRRIVGTRRVNIERSTHFRSVDLPILSMGEVTYRVVKGATLTGGIGGSGATGGAVILRGRLCARGRI